MSAELCGGRLHLDEAKHGPKRSVPKPLKSSLGTRGGNKCRSLNFPTSRTSRSEQLEAFPHKLTSAAEQGTGLSAGPGLALGTAAFPEVRLRNAQIKEVKSSRRPPRVCIRESAQPPRLYGGARGRVAAWRHPGEVPGRCARTAEWKSVWNDSLWECFVRGKRLLTHLEL